ncbi:MAG: phosphate ABC transporter ATP-binding protein PstB [Acidimicrobiia bacterium]
MGPAPEELVIPEPPASPEPGGPVFALRDMTVKYGHRIAIRRVNLDIPEHEITAVIGPSGCGKTTFLRTLNRMHDLTLHAQVSGNVLYRGRNLYASDLDPAEVRARIGMVFQKPNPFPRTIFDNVAYGLRIMGMRRRDCADHVEHALTRAALWEEVEDKLDHSALSLSGGQQQRLCIARALAVEPDVLLMDEPASALDPIATARIESLMTELRETLTIVLVTHDMQLAARVSDTTACFAIENDGDARCGVLIEHGPTTQLFTNPQDPRTEAYIAVRMA